MYSRKYLKYVGKNRDLNKMKGGGKIYDEIINKVNVEFKFEEILAYIDWLNNNKIITDDTIFKQLQQHTNIPDEVIPVVSSILEKFNKLPKIKGIPVATSDEQEEAFLQQAIKESAKAIPVPKALGLTTTPTSILGQLPTTSASPALSQLPIQDKLKQFIPDEYDEDKALAQAIAASSAEIIVSKSPNPTPTPSKPYGMVPTARQSHRYSSKKLTSSAYVQPIVNEVTTEPTPGPISLQLNVPYSKTLPKYCDIFGNIKEQASKLITLYNKNQCECGIMCNETEWKEYLPIKMKNLLLGCPNVECYYRKLFVDESERFQTYSNDNDYAKWSTYTREGSAFVREMVIREGPDMNCVYAVDETSKGNLYVGSEAAVANVKPEDNHLQKNNITHIMNVATQCKNYSICRTNNESEKIIYIDVPKIMDEDPKAIIEFGKIFEQLDAALLIGNVLVHCIEGKSRSGSVAVGYIMHKQNLTYEQALAEVKLKRPIVKPYEGFVAQLKNLKK